MTTDVDNVTRSASEAVELQSTNGEARVKQSPCPKCKSCDCSHFKNRQLLVGYNDLLSQYPSIASELVGADPSSVKHGSSKPQSWLCRRCNLIWDRMSPSQRTKQMQGCPFCANRRVAPGVNDLATLYPELIASSWDFTRNGVDPSLLCMSAKKHWWLCDLGHSFSRSIHKQLGSGCPVCSSKTLQSGVNDLYSSALRAGRVDLIEQWSSFNELPMDSVFAQSNSKAYWTCSHGHTWLAVVASRWTRGCPTCGHKRLAIGVNDLQTWAELNQPELLEQWDHDSNGEVSMSSLTSRSSHVAAWKCKNNHRWATAVSNRTGDKPTNCPRCHRSRSMGEIELFEYIRSVSSVDPVESDRNVLAGQEIDVLVGKIGFEYQGNYWHSDSMTLKRRGMTAHEHHSRKRDAAAESGVILLFIWEDDWIAKRGEVCEAILRALQNPTDIDPLLSTTSKG